MASSRSPRWNDRSLQNDGGTTVDPSAQCNGRACATTLAALTAPLMHLAAFLYGRGRWNVRTSQCRNVEDFRALARRRLPSPIFNYIDGGADDETTLRRNTEAYEECDLVPNVLAGLKAVDL